MPTTGGDKMQQQPTVAAPALAAGMAEEAIPPAQQPHGARRSDEVETEWYYQVCGGGDPQQCTGGELQELLAARGIQVVDGMDQDEVPPQPPL